MFKQVPNLLRVSCLLVALLPQPGQSMLYAKPALTVADDEYDRFRQRGDDFFKAGRYDEARRQYRNCLEVPGFENDTYAKQRLDLVANCLALLQRADEAMQQQKPADMVARLTELLALNPADPLVKGRLADYYLVEGNRQFDQQRYVESKATYQKGLAYAQPGSSQASTLNLQIKNADDRANAPVVRYVTPKRTGLKVAVGILAVGAGYYAYSLQNDFTTKRDALVKVAAATDPNGTGVIDLPTDYQRYQAAYTDVEAAKSKQGLQTACLAVAAAATVTELYLLLHKAKPRAVTGFHWKPSPVGYGLAVGYQF